MLSGGISAAVAMLEDGAPKGWKMFLRAREGTRESSHAELVRFRGGGVGFGLDGEQPMGVETCR